MKTTMRLAKVMLFLFLLALAATVPLVASAAQQSSAPVTTPAAVSSPVSEGETLPSPPGSSTTVSAAEQALADKFAPIAYLRTQPKGCSDVGERYVPISVDITLNNPEVKLRRHKRAGETQDPVVKVGPSAQDLVDTNHEYYLDLPGDSLDPGCGYEQWSRARIAKLGLTPSVYARFATQADRPGKLALQYWFYYAFDNYNNSHESDWEMIQLTFDANTVEEVLDQYPSMLSYAQHSGGENADIDDDNVQLDDGHLVTYPAEGSHADYYGDAVWLAWGEDGSGFGCDQSQADLTKFTLKAIVIPQKIDPKGPFAWALFKGRWGEYHAWQFNAPLSPNISHRWKDPIGWTDDLRLASYPVPRTSTFGIGPGDFFCTVSTLGGNLAKRVQLAPQLFLGLIGTAITLLLLSTFLTRTYLTRAIRLYARNWRIFLLSSVLLLAVAAFTTWFQQFLHDSVVIRRVSSDADQAASLSTIIDNGGISFLLQFMLVGLVAPGVIEATREIESDERTDFYRSLRDSTRKIPTILGVLLYNYAVAILMSVTIVLIPLALYRQVQWAYSLHEILLDKAGVRSARQVSRDMIKGDWLRTLGMAVLVTLVSGLPGPIVGLVLILLHAVSLDNAGYISSFIFAVSYPITIIASTLYYLRRREQKAERIAMGELGDSPGASFWLRARRAAPGRNRKSAVPSNGMVQPG